MDGDKIEAVGKAFRSEEHRSKALGIVEKIDPLPEKFVDNWIEDVVFALDNDDNLYTQYQILRQLERMAKSHPQLATVTIPVVTRNLNEELKSQAGEDKSSNKKIERCTSIIEAVIEGTRLDDDFPIVSPADVDSLLDQGDAKQRALGYRLLGRSGTSKAVEKLLEEVPYEVNSVVSARSIALKEAGTIVADSIDGNGRISTGDAVIGFPELHAAGAFTEDEGVDLIQDLSLESIQAEDEDLEKIRDATRRIAATDEGMAGSLVESALTLLEDDGENRSIAWVIIHGTAQGAPEVILSNSQRLSKIVRGADPSSLSKALDALALLPRHKPASVYHTIADQALTFLEESSGDENEAWDLLSRVGDGAPEVISDNSERISNLTDSTDLSTLSEALNVISSTSRSGTIEVYHSIAERAFTSLETASEDRDVAWSLLSGVSKRASEPILERSQRLVALIDDGGRTDTVEGLGLISTIGNRRSTLPANLGKVVLRSLESDKRSIVVAAIKSASAVGFNPPPPKLKQLAEGNTRVSKKASEALKELSRSSKQSASSLRQTLRGSEPDFELFDGDGGDLYLKRRTGEGLWKGVNVGDLRKKLIQEIVEHASRGENVPVVLPYYQPRDIVLIAIAIVLSDIGAERQVGLFSPGSRTQWGMKGEIRGELERFGLSDATGEVVSAEPIPEVIPHAYVWDGEVKNASDGDGPGRFILCKKLADLEHVGDLDLILSNLTSRKREDTSERFEDVEEVHPEATFVDTYSYYAKNERDGRPRYGPPLGLDSAQTIPGLKTVDAIVEGDEFSWRPRLSDSYFENSPDGETDRVRWSEGDDDLRALTTSASIEIEHVEAEDVSSLLDRVFEESASLRGVDDDGAGGMIFSRQLFFERLPVPVEDFDEWIRERYYDGERFLPPMIRERIEDVEQRAGSVDNLQAVRPLNRSVEIFKQLSRRLEDRNPMFEALKGRVSDAIEGDQQLVILSESPKHAEILRYSLQKRDVVTQDELSSGTISVVSPDEARGIDPKDVLVICGALHKENAGFYLHPRVAKTIVLTYDRTWANMVDRHACEFVDTLNGVVAGSDYSPYAYPELSGELEPEPTSQEEPSAASASEAEAPSNRSETQSSASRSSTSPLSKSKADIFVDAMESVSAREYREESGRYKREVRDYVVETEEDVMLEMTNHDRILRERADGSEVEYHWVSPEALTVSDEIVVVPDELETALWREQLKNLYEEEIDADYAIDRLDDWHDSIEEIWTRVADELSTAGISSDSKVHGVIYDRIREANDDFDRTRATVRSWFDAVLEADGPIDLVEDPSLTIGPRSYHDIEAIGRTFEYKKLVTEAKEIEAAMEGLRTINRQQGHELHETIKEQMNTERPTRVSKAAIHYTVDEIREVSEESERE